MLVGFGLSEWKQQTKFGSETTTSRLSPDETLRARLVEYAPSRGLNRQIEVQIDSLIDGTSTRIYGSPDEGRPEGTERLIWSKDGKWLLLVGRHFFVKEDLFLDNGDQLYLLYNVPLRKSWNNSAFSKELSGLKPNLIDGIEFTEPIRLKPR